MKYIFSHLTLKKQIDLINLKGTLRQYTLWVLSHISRESKQFQKSILIWFQTIWRFFFQCVGRNKGGVCNLRRYFRFGPILKIMNQIPVPQLFTLCWKFEGPDSDLFHIFGGLYEIENTIWDYPTFNRKTFVFLDENSLKVATKTRLGGPHLEAQVLEYFS